MFKKVIALIRCAFVKFVGRFCYDSKYLTGRHFENVYSLGWKIAEKDLWGRIFTGHNRGIPWPITSQVKTGTNIIFHPDNLDNFWGFGNYFQTIDGQIVIGWGTYIAPNVGIITTSHNLDNLDEHLPGKDVIIGERCWIGMNCVIMPGVKLGNHTIVGAGSVVTHSFEEGECVIAGNPARLIRKLG